MNHHLGILEERIEAVAVGGDGAGIERKRRRGEAQDRKEEDLNAGQDRAGVGVELDVGLVAQAQHKAVHAQQPRPEQQRTLLAAPQGGELVSSGEGAVGVLKDVGDGKIVGKDRPDQSKGGRGDGNKAGDSSPARSIGKPSPGREPWAVLSRSAAMPRFQPADCRRQAPIRSGEQNYRRLPSRLHHDFCTQEKANGLPMRQFSIHDRLPACDIAHVYRGESEPIEARKESAIQALL